MLTPWPVVAEVGGGGREEGNIGTLCCVLGKGTLLPQHLSESYSDSAFLPDHAIVGIRRFNQRRTAVKTEQVF